MAINKAICPFIKTTSANMLVIESTMSGPLNDDVPNVETGASTFGVQIRDLRDDITSYLQNPKANVGVCKLIHNPSFCRVKDKKKLIKKLEKVYKEFDGKTYNFGLIDLLATVIPCMRSIRKVDDDTLGEITDTDNWMFCSELVMRIYQKIGLIDPKIDYRDTTPVDFIPGPETTNDLAYKKLHAALSNIVEAPIWIKPPILL
jgi:hypothetical protein